MNREDIQKLLGGYATGTLTPEEQQMLFDAALGDQQLFDALAREQSLRDLLADPAAKAHLLTALDERPARWYQRLGWWGPAAAAVAMAGLSVLAVNQTRRLTAPKPVLVAEVKPAAPPQPIAAPSAAPMNAPAEPKPLSDRAAAPRRSTEPANAAAAANEEKRAEAEADAGKRVMAREAAGSQPAAPSSPVATAAHRDVAQAADEKSADLVKADPVKKESLEAAVAVKANKPVLALATENARALFYGPRQQFQQGFAAQGGYNAAPGAPQGQQQAAPAPRQQAAQNQAVTGGSVAGLLKQSSSLAPANPGVRYRLLRRSPAGDLVEAPADKLTVGDSVTVEFIANQNGLLAVSSETRTVFSGPVDALRTYSGGPLRPDEKTLTVEFTPYTGVTLTRAAAAKTRKDVDAPNLEQREGDATYVVAQPAAGVVRFTIRLDYK